MAWRRIERKCPQCGKPFVIDTDISRYTWKITKKPKGAKETTLYLCSYSCYTKEREAWEEEKRLRKWIRAAGLEQKMGVAKDVTED